MKKLIEKLKSASPKTLILLSAAAVAVICAIVVSVVLIVNHAKPNDNDPADSDTNTDSTVTDNNQEPDLMGPTVTIDMSQYKIIYDDRASDLVKESASSYAEKIATPLGIDVAIDVDNEWNTPQDKELLIGLSNRDQSQAALNKTDGKFTYNISIIGDKICVAAPTAELIDKALDYLYEKFISKSTGDGTFRLPENMDYTPAELDYVTVIEQGNCLFNVIYPRSATVGTPASMTAIEIRDFLQSYTNASQEVALLGDYSNSLGQFDLEQPSIVVGNTDYPRSQELSATMTYFSWQMEYADRQLYLYSQDVASLKNMKVELKNLLSSGLYLNGDKTIRICVPETRQGFFEDWCAEIPEYVPLATETNAEMDLISEFNEGYYRIYWENVTEEGYQAYINLVRNSGYTLYQGNSVTTKNKTSSFETYVGERSVLHAYFLSPLGQMHILVCDKNDFYNYATAPEILPEVTKPAMTVMTMDYAKQDAQDNGMSLVFTLRDGSYVIYDGGYSWDTKDLYDFLKANNQYGDKSKIYIRAWVLTHPHLDHYGNFLEFSKQYGKLVKLDTVVYDFDYEGAMNPNLTAGGTSASVMLQSILTDVKAATLGFVGAKTVTPMAGQTMYFGDLSIEMLATSEMLYPATTSEQNDHSLISRVKLQGDTFLITADTVSPTMHMKTIERVFGSYLESTFMTAPHHGLNGLASLYNTVKPKYVIFPTEQDDFEDRISVDGGVGCNMVLVQQLAMDANDPARYLKEMWAADHEEGYFTCYLPFMGSDYYDSNFGNGNYDQGQTDRDNFGDL